MKIFLIGVDHRIQWLPKHIGPEWVKELQNFSDHLSKACTDHKITLIAEEFSEEALSNSDAIDSVARGVSFELGIKHLFCDPNSQERENSGIKTNYQREQFWLDWLTASGHDAILFICGDDHLESFSKKLNSAGHQTTIKSNRWGKGWEFKS